MIDKITRAMKMDRFEVTSALNQEKSGELGVMYSMLCEEWRKENGAHATRHRHSTSRSLYISFARRTCASTCASVTTITFVPLVSELSTSTVECVSFG